MHFLWTQYLWLLLELGTHRLGASCHANLDYEGRGSKESTERFDKFEPESKWTWKELCYALQVEPKFAKTIGWSNENPRRIENFARYEKWNSTQHPCSIRLIVFARSESFCGPWSLFRVSETTNITISKTSYRILSETIPWRTWKPLWNDLKLLDNPDKFFFLNSN